MDSLTKVLKREMADYAVKGFNVIGYLMSNEYETMFTVVDISDQPDGRQIYVNLLVRLENNRIIIEEERNSKPLVDALLQAGVPRSQIVLAYAGESAEEAA